MKKDSIFDKIYNEIIEANEPQTGEFKALVTDEKSQSIVDLGIRVLAYDGAFLMQARFDYKKRELGGKSVSDFVRSKETMDENAIRETEKRVDRYFKSSFRPEQKRYHDQIKQIFIDAELERVKPLERGMQSWNPDDKDNSSEALSIFEAFNKEFLPRYKKRRKMFATKLVRYFNLKKEWINDIQIKAFNIIVDLANKKISSSSKIVRIKCIQYLEDCIEHYFPILLEDLDLVQHKVELMELRKKSGRGDFNTVCNRCGKHLLKRSRLRFCTKIKNRICYEMRRKENKKSPWPKKILMTKNLCQNCGKYSSLDHVHGYKGLIEEQFCNQACYEAFRKRRQRKLSRSG